MADFPLFTNEAALAAANVIGKSVANSGASPPTVAKVRLFDGTLIPTVNTTEAELVAAETTLTGYPSGGYSVDDFSAATFAPSGGAIVSSPIVNVVYASGPSVTIGGWWIEDSTAKVRQVFVFNPQRGLAQVGDGLPIVVQFGEGAG